MKKDWKFPLGRTLVTRSVDECMRDSSDFYCFVMESLYSKYVHGDWGDTCKEDKRVNDYAIKNGERILAVYREPNTEKTIWIITEWDRSTTTILFPDEY